MINIKFIFRVGLLFNFAVIQYGCSSFNSDGYSPLTNRKTRMSSVIGSFYDYKYEYYYLKLGDGLVINAHISNRGKKLDSISINLFLKNNSVFQLKSDVFVISSKNMKSEYAVNI